MNSFTNISLLSLVFIFAGFSCINISINGVDIPVDELYEDHNFNDSLEHFEDEEPDTLTYGNSNGYSFTHDKDLTVWTDLDIATEEAIASNETETSVTVSEVSTLLFQGEVNTLSFDVVSTDATPAEYALLNSEEYLAAIDLNNNFGDEFSFQVTTVQGQDALDVYGGGNTGSKYRVLTIDLGEKLLVIQQGAEDPLFDDIFASLELE